MTDISLDYKKAKEMLLTNMDDYCRQFFIRHACTLEYAYYLLLQEDLDGSKKALLNIKDIDVRAHWLDFMISLIELEANGYPTYFQLRNFLEIDLNILLHYYKGNCVENILRYSDSLYTINPEVYKFIGRVLYNNGYSEQSMLFLDKAKKYFYNDPELHYLLAFVYYNQKEYSKTQKSLNNCLQILPQYFPAKDLMEKISKISY